MRKPLFIARQGRRPSGLLGHVVARVMAKETAPENAETLDLLGLADGDRILEIGCGHGATLFDAAGRTVDLKLTGVDFSDVMLSVARRRNRQFIEAGRVAVDHGDSARLPYRDSTFNKIYSVHTVYFWAQPEAHLREILRVLAPGGQFVLGFRPGDDPAFQAQFPAAIYHIRRLAEIEALAVNCGFDAVRTQSRRFNSRRITWLVAAKAVDPSPTNYTNKTENDQCVS